MAAGKFERSWEFKALEIILSVRKMRKSFNRLRQWSVIHFKCVDKGEKKWRCFMLQLVVYRIKVVQSSCRTAAWTNQHGINIYNCIQTTERCLSLSHEVQEWWSEQQPPLYQDSVIAFNTELTQPWYLLTEQLVASYSAIRSALCK